jgi:glycosyltransferase involved in cell wall biosynthesis
MGHDVHVVSLPPKPVPRWQKLKTSLEGKGWPRDLKRLQSHLDGTELDHQVLDCWRPVTDDDVLDGDVVIATWWETAEWVAALSPVKGAKVYFIQHDETHEHLPETRIQATYRLPLHKIVVAKWLKRVMSERYGDSTVDLVPNSVDRTQFFAPTRGKQSTPSIGFFYAIAPFKGLDIMFAALRIVRARIPTLRMVSFGSFRPVRSLALPEDTKFFCLPPQDKIRDIYACCDVWLTASRSEGFNLPAMEAMACRTPVVSTRTGWPEEAIKSGWNGYLVNVDDTSGLAGGLEWVLTRTDDEWRNLSANAYATASSAGSWEESAKLFEKALEHACYRTMRGEIAGTCKFPVGGRGALRGLTIVK